MSQPSHRLRLASAALAVGLSTVVVAQQQQLSADPPGPLVNLRYRELTNRQDFNFADSKLGKFERPVGDLNMEFAGGSFASDGFEPNFRSYCVEPQRPMYAGETYPFTVEPLNRPAWYGLPDTADGRKEATRRAKFLRELFGRFYEDTLRDARATAAAFQVAVWELTNETDVPDGPMPYNLFAGNYKADYPDEAASPEFVRQAQRYVVSLTGDDAPFAESPVLQGLELVRLTAVGNGEFAGQSQLALRSAPGAAGGLYGPGAEPGGGGVGGLGGPGLRGPAAGVGGGFPGGGGGFGGGGGGFIGGGPVSSDSTANPGTAGPQTPIDTGVTPIPPLVDSGTINQGPNVRPGQDPPPTNPVNPTPQTPNNNNPPTDVIPAPAGVVLGGVAVAIAGLTRAARRRRA
jgi:hypothetical protein